jgi:hypothetical protein
MRGCGVEALKDPNRPRLRGENHPTLPPKPHPALPVPTTPNPNPRTNGLSAGVSYAVSFWLTLQTLTPNPNPGRTGCRRE